jgi:ABC-2 type transport system permease protein
MMRALVERFGVDYAQWRALTIASLKTDMRRAGGSVRRGSTRRGSAFLGQIIFYAVIGLMLASVVALAHDLFLGATVILTYTMFMVAIMVLLDYHTVVTAPDDYNVLGYQPITSRTYFAARITNLLVFVLVVSSIIALPSALTMSIKSGMQPAVGAALMLGAWGSATTTALLMVMLYGWLVRRVPAHKLKQTLSYLQLVTSFVVYGGYMLLPQYLQRAGFAHAQLPKSFLLLLFPPTWFASFVALARAQFGLTEVLPAAVAIAALVMTARASAGRISLEFAEKLSQIAVTGSGRVSALPSSKAPRWFSSGEGRAVYLLIRAQFRSDQRFRMGVLAILPITLLYLFMSVSRGNMGDPFLGTAKGGDGSMLYVAVILFPIMLVTTMTRSENYKAGWIFFATAANRGAIVQAMKNVVFLYFVLPYLAMMGLLFLFWMHNVLHVAVHIMMLGLISHLGLAVLILADPQLPFTRPPTKGERSIRLFMVTLFAVFFSGIAIPLTSRYIYISASRTAAAIAVLFAINMIIGWFGRARVGRLITKSEFAG